MAARISRCIERSTSYSVSWSCPWPSTRSSSRSGATPIFPRATSDPNDSRINRLNLTRSGHALVEKSFAVQTRVIKAMAAVMTDDELELTADVMNRVGAAIDDLLDAREE